MWEHLKLQPAELPASTVPEGQQKSLQTPSLIWRGIWHRHSFKCCPTRSSSQPLCGMFSMNFRSAKESYGKREDFATSANETASAWTQRTTSSSLPQKWLLSRCQEWYHVGLQVYTPVELQKKTTRWHTSPLFEKPSALLPSNGRHPVEQCQTLIINGALGPNSHQMLLYSTPKCCKPFKKIDVRFLRISMTRLMGKGRSESMRPLTASFESLWLTSQLLQVTWASLTIRMMTTNTLQVLQWHEMRHAPSSRLFSQPTELLSTKQTSWTKHLLPASKKQLVDTSPPLGKPSALLPSNGRHPVEQCQANPSQTLTKIH